MQPVPVSSSLTDCERTQPPSLEDFMGPSFAVVGIFLPVLMLSVFGFISIASWADARRRERQAFYRSEMIKKIAESPGAGAAAALEALRDNERLEFRRRVEGQKLGGLVSVSVGIGLMIFLRAVDQREPAYLIGIIPILVGLALLCYVYLIAGKDAG
jgi:hypothetical protein